MLLVAKALGMVWQPATVCLLQRLTALHQAAIHGHVAVVEALVLNGADIEAKSNGVSYIICICLSQ